MFRTTFIAQGIIVGKRDGLSHVELMNVLMACARIGLRKTGWVDFAMQSPDGTPNLLVMYY